MTERLTDEALEGRLRALACDAQATDGWESAAPDLIEAADRINGYAHMAADKRRLARDMAVMIDGADAAKQPALCDVAAMVRDLVKKRDAHRRATPADDLRAAAERCATIAECAFDDRPRDRSGHPSHMDWEDGYREGTRAAAEAIRAALSQNGGAA